MSLTILSSMATRLVLADLAEAYERGTGHPVTIEAVGGVDAARRVRAGERLDVVVLAAGVMAQLEAEGHLVAGGCLGIARSGMAMAVPDGAPHPAIDDAIAVRQALLDARRPCYSTGPSGDHLKRLWDQWGIAEHMAGRALQAPPGVPVAELLARGEADLGFQQWSELLHVPGVVILGALPAEIQLVTTFTAGIAGTAADLDAAGALVAYLASPVAVPALRRQGMEPAATPGLDQASQGG